MSKVASGRRHLAASSHHAAPNCGPRSASGSSAENAWATAPFAHSRRRRLGDQTGLGARRAGRPRSPDGPSTITSRTSQWVSPTSAMRPTGSGVKAGSPRARASTHSAPVRVLPLPRPPITAQVVQGPVAHPIGDPGDAGSGPGSAGGS